MLLLTARKACGGALPRPGSQRGVALITAVIMLLVITLLALAGARAALDTKRSTRNARDFEIAFQAAEAALRDAEIDIKRGSRAARFNPEKPEGFTVGCGTSKDKDTPTLGLCDTSATWTTSNIWDTVNWTATVGPNTVEYGTFTGLDFPTGTGLTPARKPRYLIELFQNKVNGENASQGEAPPTYIYRVTALGFGPNDTTRAMVQMYYLKDSN
ncbi:pilus assembly PilX family protein [Cupriavidus agavae]|uniref:Type IV pilus assembly protein PilX n=1 Tax=Cupriavidus agavae TaxID=1001822 RepID=A0A4Q7S4U2_9BURK|nr:PilX N-terminal domain-containing pilus assembly protein [Cupriavidus agavae]RZT41395.1 type IV pilus assembly protein PilX [Cupriavidus agavae]